MFLDMVAEIRGAVPNLPQPLAKKIIQRAWADIRRQNLWSFQLYEGPQWISPPVVNTGTAEVVQGSATVQLDATALAAVLASEISAAYSPIIARQFRVAANTIYNIFAFDSVLGTFTLDRIYAEASDTATDFSMFQCYYAAPYADHIHFTSVRDMSYFLDLFIYKTREMIDLIDPQRSWYSFPTDVVYYRNDPNTESPTYGYRMYELWGQPQTNRVYQLYGIREGDNLTVSTDTLPLGIGEDVVIEKAKLYAYQWAEANKGALPRNQGPDFKFLMGQSTTEYNRLLRDYRRRDREVVHNWFQIRRTDFDWRKIPYYSTLSNTASTGWF